jgi:hypothetical protein
LGVGEHELPRYEGKARRVLSLAEFAESVPDVAARTMAEAGTRAGGESAVLR